jgi:uncharacterized protein YkwD
VLVFVTAAALTAATVAQAARERHATSFGTRARRLLSELNDLRRARSLVPLRVSAGLTAAAREHSLDMAREGYFGHETLGGLSVGDRISRYYPSAGSRYWSVGENLAWASPDLGATRAMRLWLGSPMHRENLLTAEWREIGIGTVHVASAPGIFGGAPVTIVTVDFGVRR